MWRELTEILRMTISFDSNNIKICSSWKIRIHHFLYHFITSINPLVYPNETVFFQYH